MNKKHTAQSAFFNLRLLITLLLCAVAACFLVTRPLLAFFRPEASTNDSQRALTFAQRVAYQRAIEDVYWRHRIWPKERPDPKPSLDEVIPQAQLEKKVEDYLRNSRALEDYWHRPLTAERLQAEMERMARRTKQPEVLRELFEALDNDPSVIAECLARPVLSERLVTNFYAHDERFHGELRKRAETELRAHRTVGEMKKTSGIYGEIELVRSDGTQDEDNSAHEHSVKLNAREWDQNMQKLVATFDGAKDNTMRPKSAHDGAGTPVTQIKTGVLSALQEDTSAYYATAVIEKTKNRLKLARVSWLKESFESWRARAGNQVPNAMSLPSRDYTLPKIADGTVRCVDDTWTATGIPVLPEARVSHTAVWTGSEMIVWGGYDGNNELNTGLRYNPSTDSWTATSIINAPEARDQHTAVWTGSEMIVWGGWDGNFSNTGGRYNPSTDSGTATSIINAPEAQAGTQQFGQVAK